MLLQKCKLVSLLSICADRQEGSLVRLTDRWWPLWFKWACLRGTAWDWPAACLVDKAVESRGFIVCAKKMNAPIYLFCSHSTLSFYIFLKRTISVHQLVLILWHRQHSLHKTTGFWLIPVFSYNLMLLKCVKSIWLYIDVKMYLPLALFSFAFSELLNVSDHLWRVEEEWGKAVSLSSSSLSL